MALEKVCEGLEMDFDDIEDIKFADHFNHLHIRFKSGGVLVPGFERDAEILDWWHNKRYEELKNKVNTNAELYQLALKEIEKLRPDDTEQMRFKLASIALNSNQQEEIEKLKKENEELRQDKEFRRSAHWALVEEHAKLRLAKAAPCMYVNSPEDTQEIERLKKEIVELSNEHWDYKSSARRIGSVFKDKIIAHEKEIKRLKKKVNRCIHLKKIWHKTAKDYHDENQRTLEKWRENEAIVENLLKDIEEVRTEKDKYYRAFLKLAGEVGEDTALLEEMRAEYQQCWNTLKATNEFLRLMIKGNEDRLSVTWNPSPFKPSGKFIKE